MKQNIYRLCAIALIAISIISCNKKADAPVVTENSTVGQDSTQVVQDQEVLSNDSATVETAKGVADEEKNAVKSFVARISSSLQTTILSINQTEN